VAGLHISAKEGSEESGEDSVVTVIGDGGVDDASMAWRVGCQTRIS